MRNDGWVSYGALTKVYVGSKLCGTLPHTVVQSKVYSINCNVVGDEVKLQRTSDRYGLTFAEVQVYSTKSTNQIASADGKSCVKLTCKPYFYVGTDGICKQDNCSGTNKKLTINGKCQLSKCDAVRNKDSSKPVKCSKEYEYCQCSGDVYYGRPGTFEELKNDKHVIKTFKSGGDCGNHVFGDPLHGVVKQCICVSN